RRRPLGAQAAEFALMVQNGERLGGSVVQEVGTSRCDVRGRRNAASPPLTFCACCALKRRREFMQRSLLRFFQGVLCTAVILLATGCGEDPRYSGNASYIGGGIYGGGQGSGAPRDTVSYWDGDQASGSPSIKISLGEQRAYFYKGGVLVGVS